MFREGDFANEKVVECAYELGIGPINLFTNIEREIAKGIKFFYKSNPYKN